MLVMPKEADKEDVVISASYLVSATDGEYSASFNSVQRFTYTGGPFTPYEDLTENQVVGWIQSALGENGVESININLAAQIQAQKNPPPSPEVLPLPWNS